MANYLADLHIKLRGHDTFTIRPGWLRKGLLAVKNNKDFFKLKPLDAAVELGIGVNMVKSLRYWMQATKLIDESRTKGAALSDIANLILKNDYHFERLESWQLLLYNLVTSGNATSWYFFFNHFNYSEFSEKDFIERMINFLITNENNASEKSISDDYKCIIKSYYEPNKAEKSFDPEDNSICPFTNLRLLHTSFASTHNEKVYRKITSRNLNPYLSAYIINQTNNGETEIEMHKLKNNLNSIGKLFNLDSVELLYTLTKMEKRGLIKLIRTAGLDVVKIIHSKTDKDLIYYALGGKDIE
jgi:hypothetical protein